MEPMDETQILYSIEDYQEATLKIKRSVFTCRLARVADIEAAKQFISRISKENKTATHNCWAYVLGDQGQIMHSSDAGEPSGTAGKPMLNTLLKNQLTQVTAVVTRYFGGVKLGVRGLMDAYSESVQAAIDMKKRLEWVNTVLFRVELPYEFNDILLNQVAPFLFRIKDSAYMDTIVHLFEIRQSESENAAKLLEGYASMGKLKFERAQKF